MLSAVAHRSLVFLHGKFGLGHPKPSRNRPDTSRLRNRPETVPKPPRNQRKSKKNPRKSKKIKENQRKSKKIQENQRKSKKIRKTIRKVLQHFFRHQSLFCTFLCGPLARADAASPLCRRSVQSISLLPPRARPRARPPAPTFHGDTQTCHC